MRPTLVVLVVIFFVVLGFFLYKRNPAAWGKVMDDVTGGRWNSLTADTKAALEALPVIDEETGEDAQGTHAAAQPAVPVAPAPVSAPAPSPAPFAAIAPKIPESNAPPVNAAPPAPGTSPFGTPTP
jgi:hypothetical protein